MNKSIKIPFTFQMPYNKGKDFICMFEISGIAKADAIGDTDSYDYELTEILQIDKSGIKSPNILNAFSFSAIYDPSAVYNEYGLPEHIHEAIMGHVAYVVYPSYSPKHKAA